MRLTMIGDVLRLLGRAAAGGVLPHEAISPSPLSRRLTLMPKPLGPFPLTRFVGCGPSMPAGLRAARRATPDFGGPAPKVKLFLFPSTPFLKRPSSDRGRQ
jgi:hypothetical protein